jgi:hypothetical protein
VLAYLFWHRPRKGADPDDYERRLVRFHELLVPEVRASAAFRLSRLPFAEHSGYEDWYLVDDWAALGTLNEVAVSGRLRAPHDAAAVLADEGWGGVYRAIRGTPHPPEGARWASKPKDQTYRSFLDTQAEATVWQRQLVLGPAPEFCLEAEQCPGRQRLWPP